MTVIVIGTGIAGFAASAALLALGVSSMAVRYPLSVVVAYAIFLCLVRLWTEYHRRHGEFGADIDVIPDLTLDFHGTPDVQPWSGGGGEFGGGGAGGTWDASSAAVESHASAAPPIPDETPTPPIPEAAARFLDVDLDEGWVIIVPIALLAAGVLAAAYVVYAAPVLLAEVLLDVLLVSGLHRRLRKLEPQFWLSTALRRTWVPVAAVAVLVAASGFIMETVVPGADSIGEVVRSVRPGGSAPMRYPVAVDRELD